MKIQIFKSIQEISEVDWQFLTPPDFPFASHQFFRILETSECVGARTGWSPLYVTIWKSSDLLGAFPLFLKTNSYGEFIFDFNWAQAHETQGISYYPKLVSAIPFTPATGPKILLSRKISPDFREAVKEELLSAVQSLYEDLPVSSLHSLFIPASDLSTFEEAGFFIRNSYQYHWKNQGYESFEDFLSSLRSKRRKEILRERSQVSQAGIQIEKLTGADLTPQHAELMYRFYLDTTEKMGGYDYLTLDYFLGIFSQMKENILFVLAKNREGLEVAGALNFFGASTLYGRNWGCLENYRSLHFEVCYYQGIEFSISRGFKLFEAGAQGEHKFQRGFLPSLTYSAHQVKSPHLSQAILNFVRREKKDLEHLFLGYEAHTPFSRDMKSP